MKIIIDKSDLPKIVGKFIIFFNNTTDIVNILTEGKLKFFLEKRIWLISKNDNGEIILTSVLDGYSIPPSSKDDFVKKINDSNTIARFMYKEELEILFDYLKTNNY